jgi:hypothetical protein
MVSGEAIEVDADPLDVAPDGDYLVFDLPLQHREVIITLRHVAFVQTRDVDA